MASVHRQPNKPHWFCSYSTWDSEHQRWRRRFKSTKTTEKKQALEICRAWEQAARVGRTGKLTPDAAREVIARGVADVFTASNREALPSASVRDWCKRWLEAKEIEAEPTTHARYSSVLERFLTFLGEKADKDIAGVQAATIGRFRDQQAKELSRNSANLAVKTLRACFNAAFKQGLLTSNPAGKVDVLKLRGQAKRRNFTVDEIRRVLAVCDTEWRGLVLFGIYTGQRLFDIARLTWHALNMEERTVAFVTRKTGRRLVIPLAKPLQDYLASLPATDDPDAPLFTRSAQCNNVSTLSNRFHNVLVEAGLAEPRPHEAAGKGRNAARPIEPLCFHSLRHSATSFLKLAGAPEALAREIIGHESAAVSRGYTHVSVDDMRAAVDKLPDVTKAALADVGKHR